MGLVRDVLMAGFFGTGLHMSAFVLAFTVPNLFRRLFGEGALSAAFIPVFIETRKRDGADAGWLLARKVITLTASILASLVLLGGAAIVLAIRLEPQNEMAAAVLPLLLIMLPYMLFICLAALAMAILNSFKRFAVPAFMPCLMNMIWIAAVLFILPRSAGAPDENIHIVAWAVLIAGVAQLFGQIPLLWKCGYRPGISFDTKNRKVKRVFNLMAPAALGMAVTQINVVVDRLLAAWIGEWAPAALFFSERMIYMPLGIFATAMGTALLPALSEHVSDQDPESLNATLTESLRNILYILIPAAAGLFFMASPIIQLIFEWKQFDAASTAQTAIALQFYAPGLIVFGMAKMLVPTFYAHQDTKTPVKLSLMTVALNLILNIIFVLTWPTHMKHAGLALGTVLAETFYVAALIHSLKSRGVKPDWGDIVRRASKALLAAAGMVLAIIGLYEPISNLLSATDLHIKLQQIVATLSTIAIGMLIYFALLALQSMKAAKSAD